MMVRLRFRDAFLVTLSLEQFTHAARGSTSTLTACIGVRCKDEVNVLGPGYIANLPRERRSNLTGDSLAEIAHNELLEKPSRFSRSPTGMSPGSSPGSTKSKYTPLGDDEGAAGQMSTVARPSVVLPNESPRATPSSRSPQSPSSRTPRRMATSVSEAFKRGTTNLLDNVAMTMQLNAGFISPDSIPQDKINFNVLDWVEFFFKSRLSDAYREIATDDGLLAETILKALGRDNTDKIKVRIISGAAGRFLNYANRHTWSDLDLWMSDIKALKEKKILTSGTKTDTGDEEENQLYYRGSNSVLGLRGWWNFNEEYNRVSAYKGTLIKDKRFSGNAKLLKRKGKSVQSCPEVDAWDPAEEEVKLITPFLYTYFSIDGLGGLRSITPDNSPSALFDIYVEGYAGQIAFKIAMCSGSRQKYPVAKKNENVDPRNKYRVDTAGMVWSDPIVVKHSDLTDLAEAFMLTVLDEDTYGPEEYLSIDLWNKWIAHLTLKRDVTEHGTTTVYKHAWQYSEAKFEPKTDGIGVPGLEKWLKLYFDYDKKLWFRIKQGDKVLDTVHRTPQELFNNLLIVQGLTKKHEEEFSQGKFTAFRKDLSAGTIGKETVFAKVKMKNVWLSRKDNELAKIIDFKFGDCLRIVDATQQDTRFGFGEYADKKFEKDAYNKQKLKDNWPIPWEHAQERLWGGGSRKEAASGAKTATMIEKSKEGRPRMPYGELITDKEDERALALSRALDMKQIESIEGFREAARNGHRLMKLGESDGGSSAKPSGGSAIAAGPRPQAKE